MTEQDHLTHQNDASRRSVWRSSLFALKMTEIRLRFVVVLVVIFLFIGKWDTIKNYWDKWTRPAAGGAVELSSGDEFYCPMHPNVVRDKPDEGGATPKCPICGMPLSKRKKGTSAQLPEGVVSRVQLSPYRVQLAGIRTAEATLRGLEVEVRTVGFVTVDETRLSRIVLRVDGYLEKLFVNQSFVEVKQGEPLAEVYSPELYSAVQELLIARADPSSELGKLGREKLKLLGVAEGEIDEIERSGKVDYRLLIRSPQTGHIFQKGVVVGDHVQAGEMLFDVADLSGVWIEADVYEKDTALLSLGQAVEATVESLPNRVFAGTLGLIHPRVDAATRTNRVRFELANPDRSLRPGMYATVRLKTPVNQIEPFASMAPPLREIGDTSGSPRVAISDADLIARQKVCPVTGARLGSMGKPMRARVGEQAVFLCCAGCEDELRQQPAQYLGRLDTVTADGVLAVPESAVVDTGDQKLVYVEREPGLFEGVAVKLGPRAGGYYAVVEGLLPGDRVAAAGSFLVDAETRLNPAAAAAYFGASGAAQDGARSSTPRATGAVSHPATGSKEASSPIGAPN